MFIVRVLFLLLCFFSMQLSGQNLTISGYVQSTNSHELLIGANVYNPITYQGTSTDVYGFFSLTVPKGDVELKVSFVGCADKVLQFKIERDTTLVVNLNDGYEILEVSVKSKNSRAQIYAPNVLHSNTVEVVPTLTGQSDLLRSYQLLPGIAQGNEGSNDIYVRGGSSDQNLILLDDVPLYYVNHVGGFFSVFNEHGIKDASLYKSSIPARYSGRLSSVVDIRLKDGNMKKMSGNANVGIYSAGVFIEGPIKEDIASFIFSARKSITDFYMHSLSGLESSDNSTVAYGFWDTNGKVKYNLSQRSRLYFSFYAGRDHYNVHNNNNVLYTKYDDELIDDEPQIEYQFISNRTYRLYWGNLMANLRLNHQFSTRWIANISLSVSNYLYGTEDNNMNSCNLYDTNYEEINSKYQKGLSDYTFKFDHRYHLNNRHDLSFGVQGIVHHFDYGHNEINYYVDSLALPAPEADDMLHQVVDTIYGGGSESFNEYGVYFEDFIAISTRLKLSIGAHYGGLRNSFYSAFTLQPRLAIQYQPRPDLSLRTSYNKTTQYIHMLSSNMTSLPSNVWIPSNNFAPPESAQQVSLGAEKYFDTAYRLQADVYYKYMSNLIEFDSNADYMSNQEALYLKVETGGTGNSYGLELMAEKCTGRFTGWISATFTKTTREFESLNGGRPYEYAYSRPFDISLFARYQLKQNIELVGTWDCRSGVLTSLSTTAYDVVYPNVESGANYSNQTPTENISYVGVYYPQLNNYRMPVYHKLNLSVRFSKQKKRGMRTWTFGVDNVYNQMNVYSLTYKELMDETIDIYKLTIFPLMPSFTYSYTF